MDRAEERSLGASCPQQEECLLGNRYKELQEYHKNHGGLKWIYKADKSLLGLLLKSEGANRENFFGRPSKPPQSVEIHLLTPSKEPADEGGVVGGGDKRKHTVFPALGGEQECNKRQKLGPGGYSPENLDPLQPSWWSEVRKANAAVSDEGQNENETSNEHFSREESSLLGTFGF
ncbi:expressed unknown protein [Seminavis robusta]|uniref:Uncharacterized protein n=1 Tax=Seminavis robusta TaxID=568900 RepID=A0A9N8E9H0_9STRA|nr:expressed unknown protein [Seminavis robusta]|eukprot:Sro772_g200260.1 n/a (175) ;mRNA; f:21562-22086